MENVIYTWLIFLSLFSLGGCLLYDYDLETIEQVTQADELSNKLKLEADLATEFNQDLLGIHSDANTNDWTGFGEEQKFQREATGDDKNFVGTNLFDGNRKKCFSMEEVALLTARRDFEALIPKDLPQCLLNDKMVAVFLHYFNIINEVAQRISDDLARGLIEKALYDTIGGYMNYYLLPITKYSYYGGKVNTNTVENVLALYRRCKELLNTNGNGWKAPIKNILSQLKSVHIEPLRIKMKDEKPFSSCHKNEELKFDKLQNDAEESMYCNRLDLSSVFTEAQENQMIVPLPKLEAEDCDGYLGNVWLPFKHRRSFNLRSKKSAFIVVKFYETVSRCYRFQCICQDEYNDKFRNWISENVQQHLEDDQFYPGLGAILRITEVLKRGKKAANIEEYDKKDYNYEFFNENSPDEMVLSKYKNNNAMILGGNRVKDIEEEFDNDDVDHEEEYGELDGAGKFSIKINCPKKPFDKKKKKPYSSTKKTQTNTDELAAPEGRMNAIETSKSFHFNRFYSWLSEKHICWLLIFLLLILLMILLCILLRKRNKTSVKMIGKSKDTMPETERQRPPFPKSPPSAATTPGSSQPSPSQKKKRGGLYNYFHKPKKDAQDEISIKPENPSVLGQDSVVAKSSSMLYCQPPRCIPIKKLTKANRESPPQKSGAAIIETTSMDYSSSEVEDRGNEQKLITINEKSKSNKQRNAKNGVSPRDTAAPRIGIQRHADKDTDSNTNEDKKMRRKKKKGDLRSTSWETMYES